MDTELIAEDSSDRYTEDPTDDELLAAEMGGTPAELTKSEVDLMVDGLEKAGTHRYISKKRVGKRWEYKYPDDKKKQRRRAEVAKQSPKVAWGKLPAGKTAAEHIEIAEQFLDKHKTAFPLALASLKQLAGSDAKVKGRVKALRSALNKMVEKPHYTTADKLQDGTGMRVVHGSVDEVKATVAKIKAKYKVIEEDDYIAKPKGDYRSHHLIIEGPGKLPMELQVRTKNQDAFGDWCHDVYKPVNKKQAKAQKHPEVISYARDVSAHFWALDTGQEPPPKPPCTKVVSDAFGCL
jgi:ppGpp synthetase/RelA/SpoT-type nucleotidyltranferase